MIPIYSPYVAPNTKKYLNNVVKSNWYSSGGYYYDASKEKLKDILCAKHVLLTNNGTTATHLLSKILKNKKSIEKIICPDGVYVAAWNSFLFDSDLKIQFVDSNLKTWNYDRIALEEVLKKENPDTTAVLVVHNIGNPFLLKEKNFLIVEDNCEGFLGKYEEEKMTGTECLASSISFFSNKNVTCGEGGAVITNDDDSYHLAQTIHGQGQSSTKFVHSHLGYNYRMTNLAAALLFSQLEVYEEILEKKKELFDFYKSALKDIENIYFQETEKNCIHSNWMFGIRIKGSSYTQTQKFFSMNGVETRPMFYTASQQPYLEEYIDSGKIQIINNANAKILNQEIVILPSFPDLSKKDRKKVINVIKKYSKMVSDKK